MYDVLSKMIQGSIESSVQMGILYGVVSSDAPIKIKINQKLELPIEAFIFPEHLQEKKLATKDYKTTASSGGDYCSGSSLSEVPREYILTPKLKSGDRLIIININKSWLIFDKVGDPNGTITITQK